MSGNSIASPESTPGTSRVAARNNSATLQFFLATFAFTWIVWIPGAYFFPPTGTTGFTGIGVWFLIQSVGAAGPSLMAILVIQTSYGKAALQRTLERYKLWRVGARWYLAAVLLVPLLTVTALVLLAVLEGWDVAISPDSGVGSLLGSVGLVGLLALLPVIFVSQIFSSPLLEELGWRGFALPQLQRRFGALVSSLILGLI